MVEEASDAAANPVIEQEEIVPEPIAQEPIIQEEAEPQVATPEEEAKEETSNPAATVLKTEEDTVAAGEAEMNSNQIKAADKRQISQPKYVQRMPPTLPDKKCFVKIVAIGDSGVGKTSLIQMFEHTRFTENFKPTIGADFSNKEISIDGKVVTLQIWDTAGQERYQSLGTAFYRGADCAFLVYDLTNSWSFDNIPNWKNSFLQKSMVSMPETFPFMVVGNKLDLEEEGRAVETKQAQEYCQREGMEFLETSARENMNVEEAFKVLAKQALTRQAEMQRNLDASQETMRQIERENRLKITKQNQTQAEARQYKQEKCKC